MVDNSYSIDHFDRDIIGKESINVPAGSVNSSALSINLYGHGYKNYGEGLLENIVHLLENFCSENREPSNPTEGQLWYKRSTKELLLYMGSKAPQGSNGWRNIIPRYGWDSSQDLNDPAAQFITVDNIEQYLDRCLRVNGSNGMNEGSNIKLGSTWVIKDANGKDIIDGGIESNVDYDLNATSKKYVDLKVKTYVDGALATALPVPNNGSDISALQINTALLTLDPVDSSNSTSHLYIRKDSERDSHRTMTKPLILPTFSDSYNDTSHSNYAATMGWVMGIVGNAGGTGTIDISGKVNKAGDTMTGYLKLVDLDAGTKFDNPDKSIAASRAYVDEKIKASLPAPSIPSTSASAISFTELPDGTKMIYGRQVGTLSAKQGNIYAGIVNINVGNSIKGFIDNNYVVTVTDHSPNLSKGGVNLAPQDHCWSRNIEYPAGKKFENYPLIGLFNTYDKNETYFNVSSLVWGGSTLWADSIAFDFIAIGRWK